MKRIIKALFIVSIIVALTPTSLLMSCNNGGGEPDEDVDGKAKKEVVDSVAVKDTTIKN